MTRTSNRAQRFWVMCAVAAVVALGWSPLQALADDGAIDAVGSTVDDATEPVADAVTVAVNPVVAVSGPASGTVAAVATTIPDPVDKVSDAASATVAAVATTIPDPVDKVSDAASGAVDKVSDAASGAVDKVSDAASGAVDKVSDAASGAVDKVSDAASGAAGSVSNAVGDTTAAVGSAAGNAVSGALKSAARANETSAVTGAPSLPSFPSQQAAVDRRSSGATRRSIHDDLVLLAERGRATAPLGDDGSGSCVTMLGTVCVTTTAGDAPGWEGSVASVLQKLLALTGSGLLTWIAASCILTVMGALALYETRRRSERSSLGSA